MAHRPPLVLLTLAFLASSCQPIRFTRDGGLELRYDLEALEAELVALDARNGISRVSDRVWVPLLYLDSVTFQSVDSRTFPGGRELSELSGVGPVFFWGHGRRTAFDSSRRAFELVDRRMLLWRLWEHEQSVVRTPYGLRVASQIRLLFGLLPGFTSVNYYGDEATPIYWTN